MNKILSLVLTAAFFLTITATALAQTATPPAAGDGSRGNPYRIASLENLYWISQNPDQSDKHFIQTADIDASATENWVDGNGIGGWTPINNTAGGSYNGGGHTISGLFINRPGEDNQGLFGQTERDGIHVKGRIINLGLVDVNITGNNFVGGLVGSNRGARVSNSYATGAVTGEGHVGGLVGLTIAGATLEHSHADVEVTGSSNVGGLVGTNESSIRNSHATGTVTGTGNNVGGLVGNKTLAILEHSYATGQVNGTGDNIGGLVGQLHIGIVQDSHAAGDVSGDEYVGGLVGLIAAGAGNHSNKVRNSYAAGDVSGNKYVGGLVGQNVNGFYVDEDNFWENFVQNTYATGQVSGEEYVGGLVGDNWGIVTNAYATGAVSGTVDSVGGLVGRNKVENDIAGTIEYTYSIGSVTCTDGTCGNVGGLAGENDEGTITGSFWNTETSGQATSAGGTGKDTGEMQNSDTFTDAGWDFPGTWTMSSQVTFGGYPTLIWTGSYAAEPALVEGVYQVENLSHLIWIAEKEGRWGNDYLQIANIDASITSTWDDGKGWTPIGNTGTPFTGIYDGDGRTISRLSINRPSANDQALFGYTGIGAEIKNLDIADSNIAGQNRVGTLVGENHGIVKNSCVNGTLSGNDRVGGLVGSNPGTISNCCAEVSVNGNDRVGGLVGSNDESISNSYATGAVSGNTSVGGLVGANTGTVTDSFYDEETTGKDDTGKGTPKTTAAMQNIATFNDPAETEGLDEAWPIVRGWEAFDPPDTIWGICQGGAVSYPFHLWQFDANPCPPEAVEPEGNGTEQTPYLIETLENLYWISRNSDTWDRHYRQTQDITIPPGSEFWDGGSGWMPIGNPATEFTGTYDGDGHTISELFINRPDAGYQALFGYTGENAIIKNLGLIDLTITGGYYLGGLVGVNRGTIENIDSEGTVEGASDYHDYNHDIGGLVGINYGTIINSSATGTVTGIGAAVGDQLWSGAFPKNIGGLVGKNYGAIENSCAAGAVTGTAASHAAVILEHIGGLVGKNSGTVENSCATGSVIGFVDVANSLATRYFGGLVGNNSGTVTNAYATGDVTKGNTGIGGLAGGNSGTVIDSYASGSVNGNTAIGGMVGYNDGSDDGNAVINTSYATGSVNGFEAVGGLVGYNDGDEGNVVISNSYASGSVNGNQGVGGLVGYNIGRDGGNAAINNSYASGTVSGNSPVGGLVGLSLEGIVTNSFWDVDTSNIGSSGDDNFGATGKTTKQLKSIVTFSDADWDIEGDAGIEPGYPFLAWTSEAAYTEPWVIGIREIPTVTTQTVTDIDIDSAIGHATITYLGTQNPTQHGHVWSTSVNPTVDSHPGGGKTEKGAADSTGAFTSDLTGLSPNTTYYVRAYATNSAGTAYGAEVEFTTLQTNTYNLTVINGTGTGTYTAGTVVNIQANAPAAGKLFDKWTGDTAHVADVNSASTTVTMPPQNIALTATYKDAPPDTSSLTVNSGTGSGEYTAGTVVNIQADSPDGGKIFDKWTGDIAHVADSNSASTTVTMPSQNITVTATYKDIPQNTYSVSLSANPSTGGTVSGGGVYDQGENATVKATPNPGYSFVNWTEDGAEVSRDASYTFEVTKDRTLVAHFSTAVVNIPDPNLKAAIRAALDKPDGDITVADMRRLTRLEASLRGIADLSGLEEALNLTELYLDDNEIADISALSMLVNLVILNLSGNLVADLSSVANLIKLEWLDVSDNYIVDITPLGGLLSLSDLYLQNNQAEDITALVVNSDAGGLGAGDFTDLRSNFLDLTQGSQNMLDIETLLGREVDVEYDPQREPPCRLTIRPASITGGWLIPRFHILNIQREDDNTFTLRDRVEFGSAKLVRLLNIPFFSDMYTFVILLPGSETDSTNISVTIGECLGEIEIEYSRNP